jgi:hypothetical protein
MMTQSETDRLAEIIQTEILSQGQGQERTRRDICNSVDRLSNAQATLAAEYGRRRGWRRTRRDFGVKTLAAGKVINTSGWFKDHGLYDSTFIDHPYCYRDERRRAVATVAHLYGLKKDATINYATQHGLVAEFPKDFLSWYFPGETDLVVYRRKS